MKRAVGAAVVALQRPLGWPQLAMAAQPGPGDKQCIPGQQGNPDPHKASVWSEPLKAWSALRGVRKGAWGGGRKPRPLVPHPSLALVNRGGLLLTGCSSSLERR
jgi:hypothetical protein